MDFEDVCAILGIIFLVAVLGYLVIAAIGANMVSDGTITVEERIGAHGEDGSYLIVSEEGEMFTIEDNMFRLQFDASDRYMQMKEGNRYAVVCTGWRYQLLSWYRNIVSITPA